MIEVGKRAYLLFDGDCGFCAYLADVAGKMDKKRLFIIEPYQRFRSEELERFGISYEKCSRRLYAISPKGRVYAGTFAVNYFLSKQFPWSVIVVLIHLLPILLLLEVIGYWIVASNRHRISRWFGLKSCVAGSVSNLAGSNHHPG
jgi:predicted DCC family thiol-disulfide oxidoreductase YuxK